MCVRVYVDIVQIHFHSLTPFHSLSLRLCAGVPFSFRFAVVYERANGIKQCLQTTFTNLENSSIERCSHKYFKPLLYVLTFFHAAMQVSNTLSNPPTASLSPLPKIKYHLFWTQISLHIYAHTRTEYTNAVDNSNENNNNKSVKREEKKIFVRCD